METLRACGGVVALLLVTACGGDSPSAGGTAVLFPEHVNTGFDQNRGYAVPVAASGATGITWTSSDPGVATVTGTDALATITGVAAGTVTITAKATGTASVTVDVKAYVAGDAATGKTSFDTLGCAAAGCHTPSGPDITPSGLGKHTDAEILAAITQGQNPEGGELSTGAANHSFAAEATIVTYLRSLAPAGTPIDDE
jgi:hypothetical protein